MVASKTAAKKKPAAKATSTKTVTTKKAPAKKPTAKSTAVKKPAAKKVVAASTAPRKRTASKKAAKKTEQMRTFKVYKNGADFKKATISRQTIYWIVLLGVITISQLWILKIQLDIAELTNSIVMSQEQ